MHLVFKNVDKEEEDKIDNNIYYLQLLPFGFERDLKLNDSNISFN